LNLRGTGIIPKVKLPWTYPSSFIHQFHEFTNCQTGVIWKITVVWRKHLKKFGVGKVERCSCRLLVGQRLLIFVLCKLAKNGVESNL